MHIEVTSERSPKLATREIWPIVMLLVVAALAFWELFGRWSVPRTTASQIASTAEVTAPEVQNGPDADAEHSDGVKSSTRRGADHGEPWSGAATWQAEFGCLEATCAPTWNLAQSAEEAAWLHRNGYGGRSERVILAALSDSELHARFDAGDLVAGAVYHDRLVQKRDQKQWHFAIELASRGSTLALYKIASQYYARGPLADEYFFAAALRIAQMRGDRWAINEIHAWQPVMNYDLDSSLIESRVQILLRNIEQTRQKHGYPPLTIDIRPLPPDAESTAMVAPGG